MNEQPCCFNVFGNISEQPLNTLKFRDWLFKLFTLLCVFSRGFETGLPNTHSQRTDSNAALIKNTHHHVEPTTFGAQQSVRGKANVIERQRADGRERFNEGQLIHCASSSRWIEGPSLQHLIAQRARSHDYSVSELVAPASVWIEALGGENTINGRHLDSIWRNAIVDGDALHWIDQEWAWSQPLDRDLVIARALLYFAQSQLGAVQLGPALAGKRVDHFILEAAEGLGSTLTHDTLNRLAHFEAELLNQIVGTTGDSRRKDVGAVLQRRFESATGATDQSTLRRVARWLKRRLR